MDGRAKYVLDAAWPPTSEDGLLAQLFFTRAVAVLKLTLGM